ncbi:putative glycosyl [Golovinomyces cichoracearum]|uniref:Putative glycosyl n=1 Tax=Golovinomyces cichoracearum TaxID=62708 RepID=A0A420H778_9PEZI|nr:putative glycosyl [Golovinomyces cichoracearum]
MYHEEDGYSGIDDSYDFCLGIFYDTCRKSGVTKPFFKDAFSTMLKGSAREYYHMNLIEQSFSFDQMIRICTECFEITVKELCKTQLSLPERFNGNECLRDAIIDAARDIRKYSRACFKPANTVEALCADIRASIVTEERIKQGLSTFHSHTNSLHDSNIGQQLYIDRQYGENRISRPPGNLNRNQRPKVCFVCKKNGCWSSKHTKEERTRTYNAFQERLQAKGKPFNDRHIRHYVVEYEGELSDNTDEEQDIWDSLIMNVNINDSDEDDNLPIDSQYITAYGPIIGYNAVGILNNQSLHHSFARIDSSIDSICERVG